MNFVANESVDRHIVERLRDDGHFVWYVVEMAPSISDDELLQIANNESAPLIAGPTTTLPAMAAVWSLVTRKVFPLYVSFSLLGAVIIGYFYRLTAGFFKNVSI